LHDDAELREDLAARGYQACRERWSEEVVVGRLLETIAAARGAQATACRRRESLQAVR
jgi:hypothetical protein